DKCITLGMPVSIIKANIRISNAIIDASKKLPVELTYQIVEEELLEKILLAKRDFVKRECRLAIEILNLLKIKDVDEVIERLKSQYQR
ncbi:MAG: hypothetical protein IIX12_05130, partial [Alistipes sp.]|nr:hypothetical protein [Alistipes sp.]